MHLTAEMTGGQAGTTVLLSALALRMPARFIARAFAAEELPELNTFLVALADDADTPTRILELQKALEPEDDEEDDFDSYCLVMDAGATHYGGVTSCVLSEHCLVLRLSPDAAEVFETDGFEITLDLKKSSREALRAGLQRLFQDDRLTPAELVLS